MSMWHFSFQSVKQALSTRKNEWGMTISLAILETRGQRMVAAATREKKNPTKTEHKGICDQVRQAE